AAISEGEDAKGENEGCSENGRVIGQKNGFYIQYWDLRLVVGIPYRQLDVFVDTMIRIKKNRTVNPENKRGTFWFNAYMQLGYSKYFMEEKEKTITRVGVPTVAEEGTATASIE
ncbi:hypothetical protein ACJX0J_031234, partial [Zea mays]